MPDADEPEIAVIVISHGPRDTLPDATRSVMGDDVAAEVIVVHSGPGDPRPMLQRAGIDVPVIMAEHSMYAGGARNLGLQHVSAPVVAFLADDCIAAPGWSRARLSAHRAGHDAVASSLVSHRPTHPTSLAIHLSRHIRRMPGIPTERALRFGASYRRSVFDEHGPFRDDMAGGEDAEFNDRLGGADRIHWTPDVITAHRGLELLLPAVVDQFRRGRLRTRSDRERDRFVPRGVGAIVRARVRFLRRFGLTAVGPELAHVYKRSRPALAACLIAYALGEWFEGRRG